MTEPFVCKPSDVDSFDVPHHEETNSRELINPSRGSDDVVFRLTSMGPGGQDYWHAHEDSEQLIFVRSGTGSIRISHPDDEDDQETHDLEPESFVYLPRDAYHQVTNTGEEILELIVIWTPPYESLDEWAPENN
ncbi:cupin domain-containing protein [Natronosalvus halobius]|uniref:cupin domain-containing protein n=1 Tax=Natronosalvus halobius TaxID=2953746 RepID=UPI00209CC599|nr:cupin domain-containing protein [Natronosalvus halobius]USZ73577.1 cupin domain-containing protein [Natronosalvus halobius]